MRHEGASDHGYDVEKRVYRAYLKRIEFVSVNTLAAPQSNHRAPFSPTKNNSPSVGLSRPMTSFGVTLISQANSANIGGESGSKIERHRRGECYQLIMQRFIILLICLVATGEYELQSR